MTTLLYCFINSIFSLVVQRRKAPESLILDIKTSTETVPVELRSPRREKFATRQASRDKRNACVFLMPSSDSDNDQLFSNFARQNQEDMMKNTENNNNTMHISPVKFVPSLLQRNYAKSISSSGNESSPKTRPKHAEEKPIEARNSSSLNAENKGNTPPRDGHRFVH